MRAELFGEDEREKVREALALLRGALAWSNTTPPATSGST